MGMVANQAIGTNLMPVDYKDENGIMRRVLLPDGASPQEGIPVSLPVDELYEHMPLSFRQRLVEELWNRGLVSSADFLRPGAADLIRSALLSVVRWDTLDIQTFAKENKHG